MEEDSIKLKIKIAKLEKKSKLYQQDTVNQNNHYFNSEEADNLKKKLDSLIEKFNIYLRKGSASKIR